ncbi:MAG: acyl-CoA thioesterase [Thermoguttaceae bacterium]|nr:acyl-CoA thioesterase [Thermoguttaceae bacterium]
MNEQGYRGVASSVFGRCVEVTDENLDVWNHTNNVCYVQWMQDVAVEHSVVLGWDSRRYLDSGAIWVVRSHKIDYRKSTYKGDKLLVQTWIAEMKRASCVRRYRFLELPKDCNVQTVEEECRFVSYESFVFPQTAIVATAETIWAFVSTHNFHPVRVFPELNEVFRQSPNLEARFPGSI